MILKREYRLLIVEIFYIITGKVDIQFVEN